MLVELFADRGGEIANVNAWAQSLDHSKSRDFQRDP